MKKGEAVEDNHAPCTLNFRSRLEASRIILYQASPLWCCASCLDKEKPDRQCGGHVYKLSCSSLDLIIVVEEYDPTSLGLDGMFHLGKFHLEA